MRYRIIAHSLTDRRRLLAIDDTGAYSQVTLTGLTPTLVPIMADEARRLQFDRAWVPARDHRWHTLHELSKAATSR